MPMIQISSKLAKNLGINANLYPTVFALNDRMTLTFDLQNQNRDTWLRVE